MNVEESFNAFVQEIGGELVSELLPKAPPFENADYIFRKVPEETVVAELKCLTEDSSEKVSEERWEKFYACWAEKGFVSKPPAEGFRPNLKELPLECQRDLWKWLGRPIQAQIGKANRQIKQTKEHFGLTSAKGLLLLVNDGNYSLQSDVVLSLANQVIGKYHAGIEHYHSGINSVVYFTVNMEATMPNTERDLRVWVEAQREGILPVSKEFLKALQVGWVAFFERAMGEPVPTFRQGSIGQIEFKRPRKD